MTTGMVKLCFASTVGLGRSHQAGRAACAVTKAFVIVATALGMATGSWAQPAPPQAGPTVPERVAALKQSLKTSQEQIRRYEWVETTALSLKGDEKSKTQNRCYYGADGKLQKTPMGTPAAPKADSGGGRGGRVKQKVVQNKKDDIQDYMKQATALVHKYVPPTPDAVQRAKDAGKIKMSKPEEGRVRLEIADYLQAGDRLTLDVDPASNRLLAVSVASYIDKAEDAVTLAVQMNVLPDGTGYVAKTTLDAKAKNIVVVIENTGHRPMAK